MLFKYFHTVRHLKFSQLYRRVWFKLQSNPALPDKAPKSRKKIGKWTVSIRKKPSFFPPNRFRFLNEEHTLNCKEDWNNPDIEKLWLFNLHYFDDLNSESINEREKEHRALISKWMNENPPAKGIGWAPYPLSLRIVNWVKWILTGNEPDGEMLLSLYRQVVFQNRRVEYHLLGNHIFENAKALIFGGLYFDGGKSGEYLKKAVRLIKRELKEQVLPDGGHFERSPMYHCIILEGILDIINIIRIYNVQLTKDLEDILLNKAEEMLQWIKIFRHPDGRIPFFNDTALDVAPEPEQLIQYAGRLGIRSAERKSNGKIFRFDDSGYYRLNGTHVAVLIDAAPVGPDYIPGHAHADTLSFELSYKGKKMLVNSGTSTYGDSAERLRQRGTAAHNSLTVDRADSSEVWSRFRVARRARIKSVSCSEKECLEMTAAHDGYQRLNGVGLHKREWNLKEKELIIVDEVAGRNEHLVEIHFHFHPDYKLEESKEGSILIMDKNGKETAEFKSDPNMNTAIEDSTYHPEFGIALSNKKIILLKKCKLPCLFRNSIQFL